MSIHVHDWLLNFGWLEFTTKVIQTLMPDLLGLLLGILLTQSPAMLREPARWLFVVPAVVFPVVLAAAYFTDLHDLLFSVYGVRGAEYEGAGVIGLAFPACGICLYSIGIRTGDRHSHPLARVYEDEDVIPADATPKTAAPEGDVEKTG